RLVLRVVHGADRGAADEHGGLRAAGLRRRIRERRPVELVAVDDVRRPDAGEEGAHLLQVRLRALVAGVAVVLPDAERDASGVVLVVVDAVGLLRFPGVRIAPRRGEPVGRVASGFVQALFKDRVPGVYHAVTAVHDTRNF